jgi:hypothetical protein
VPRECLTGVQMESKVGYHSTRWCWTLAPPSSSTEV